MSNCAQELIPDGKLKMNKMKSIKDEQIPPVQRLKRIRINEVNLKRKIEEEKNTVYSDIETHSCTVHFSHRERTHTAHEMSVCVCVFVCRFCKL